MSAIHATETEIVLMRTEKHIGMYSTVSPIAGLSVLLTAMCMFALVIFSCIQDNHPLLAFTAKNPSAGAAVSGADSDFLFDSIVSAPLTLRGEELLKRHRAVMLLLASTLYAATHCDEPRVLVLVFTLFLVVHFCC